MFESDISIQNRIFSLENEQDFEKVVLEVFQFQAKNVPVYREYLKLLNRETSSIQSISEIPFLPISFFKTHKVLAEGYNPELFFQSSGTTSANSSKHWVVNPEWYEKSFIKGFYNYTEGEDRCILALLPNYLERGNSSLVYMVNGLIEKSTDPDSGFFLNNLNELVSILKRREESGQKTLLLGVTYALLDLIDILPFKLKNTWVMETGGMKGRRKEMVKEELHELLQDGFGVNAIHSEYGMTELFSQAYSKGNNLFSTPPWMRILIRDTTDPFSYVDEGKSGAINVIDLANYYSCSFIATDDLGKLKSKTEFEVLGRFDNADVRGCNLMVQ